MADGGDYNPIEFALTAWRDSFYPYQLAWITEPSRKAVCNKARQIGVSHASAGGCVLGSLVHGRTQIVLSASQRQSRDVLAKCKKHAEFLAAVGYPGALDFTTDSSTELAWASGGRILALPANENTARSYTGDVWLDEFAYHKDPEAIRDAAFATALKGDRRIRVFSTPNGDSGLFYDLVTGQSGADWAHHEVTLDQAISQGCDINKADAISLAGGDERLIAQWYGCSFIGTDLQYYPSEWLHRALAPGPSPTQGDSTGRIYAGLDLGRTKDLTVLCVVYVVKGMVWLWGVHSWRRTEFSAQREAFKELRTRYGWHSISVDATGMGMQMAEDLVKAWGAKEVHPVVFTNAAKGRLMTGAFKLLAADNVRWGTHRDGKVIATEAKTIRRVITKSGAVSYPAKGSTDSHADHWTAFTLAADCMEAGARPRRGLEDGEDGE